MDHILQFAVSIDDEAIQNNIMKNAEEKITKQLEIDIRNRIFEKGYYRPYADSNRDPLSEWTKDRVKEFFENHKNEIIEKAAILLANNLVKTKAAKEVVKKLGCDDECHA